MQMSVGVLWALIRPGFLIITLVGVLLGSAMAAICGCGFDPWLALSYGGLTLLLHAAVNVLNDVADDQNGADRANVTAIPPFSGGSGLLISGRVSVHAAKTLGFGFLIVVAGGGILLVALTGGGLLVIGAIGLVLGWAYSMPPLRLMSRGLGELAVVIMLWLLVVGADYVQRQSFLLVPAVTAMSFAILGALILLAASFPDRLSDAQVGKNTLTVMLGPRLAAWAYLLIALEAYTWLGVGLVLQIQPAGAVWGFVSAPLSLAAAWLMIQGLGQPKSLRRAIGLTIGAALIHGLVLAAGLLWGGRGL
jgi:1,4-dihydroxy-2-naphthoate octaprenyltransferase